MKVRELIESKKKIGLSEEDYNLLCSFGLFALGSFVGYCKKMNVSPHFCNQCMFNDGRCMFSSEFKPSTWLDLDAYMFARLIESGLIFCEDAKIYGVGGAHEG